MLEGAIRFSMQVLFRAISIASGSLGRRCHDREQRKMPSALPLYRLARYRGPPRPVCVRQTVTVVCTTPPEKNLKILRLPARFAAN